MFNYILTNGQDYVAICILLSAFKYRITLIFVTDAATTEVYWATVVEGENHLLVTCHFNKYSTAKGCFVDIKLLTDFTLDVGYETFSISRLNGSHVASSCISIRPQSYAESVMVKDWKANGRTGPLSVTTFMDQRETSPCKSSKEYSSCFTPTKVALYT